MGSYCRIQGKTKVFSAQHKLYGYVEDEEIRKMHSYRYLVNAIDDELESILNIRYIGEVCRLSRYQALTFMILYAIDCDKEFLDMWDAYPQEVLEDSRNSIYSVFFR